MTDQEWTQLQARILELEAEGLVTRTFRRLDPVRQRAVITAILDEAIDKGPAALNIKQVAERAGVAIGSLYAYFGSRDGLMAFTVALCTRFIQDTFDSFRPYFAQIGLRDALRMYLLGGLEWSQTQVGLVQFFVRAAYHGESELSESMVRPIADTLRDWVHDMLAAAIARGEVRPDIDLEATTRVVHALTLAVGDSQIMPYLNTYFQVSGADMPFERVLDALVALVLQGIGTPPDSESSA